MLNKNLLRFRKQQGQVKPKFIDPTDSQLLTLAEQLLGVYQPGEELPRHEIEDMVMGITNGFHDIVLAKGLNKIIQDKCEFSHAGMDHLPEFRDELFQAGTQLLKAGGLTTLEAYQKAVAKSMKMEAAMVYQQLYSDHPDHEVLIKAPRWTPKELLDRYNLQLVQSMLLYSGALTVVITEPDTGQLRRLFKYLKFFRLMAQVFVEDKRKSAWTELNAADTTAVKFRLEIDGPMTLLESTTKYGLQLASFFPALVTMSKWRLRTTVNIKDKPLTLMLNESSELVSHYRNFSAYIPPEIKQFHQHFNEKQSDWKIAGNTPFLKGEGNALLFPDLCFEQSDGRGEPVYAELYHRWHSGGIAQRLKQLDELDQLILGIDRSVYDRPQNKKLIDESGLLDQRIFLFRDFPTVNRVCKVLKHFE